MKQTGKPTPPPWRFEPGTMTIRAVPANYWLATMDSWDGMVDNIANAQLIVRAVNSHAELWGVLNAIRVAVKMTHASRILELLNAYDWPFQVSTKATQLELEQLATRVCGGAR